MNAAVFTTGSPFRHIAVMTTTASLGLMSIFLVDLADMYFISLLGEAELAAAIGYAGSILFFTMTISIGISITMSVLVSRAIGSGERERARRLTASVGLFSLCVSVPVAIGIWLAAPVLVSLLGADGRAHDLAVLYLRIVIPSMPILGLGMAAGGALRAVGDARRAMSTTMMGGLVNLILDPILIFGLGWDIAGAALASVAARLAVFATGIFWIRHAHDFALRPDLSAFRRDLGDISNVAVPAILTIMATPVANAFVTATIAGFGTEAVAGYAVIGRMMPVAFGVIFALSGAVGPIIGQNAGAGLFPRVRRTILDAILFSTSFVLTVSLMLFLFQNHIIALFDIGAEAGMLVAFFCTYTAPLFAFDGVQFVVNAAFNNLGRPKWSTAVNWAKATLGTIPFVWLGSHWFGATGALAGQAAGAVLSSMVALFLVLKMTRTLAPVRHHVPSVPDVIPTSSHDIRPD